VFRLRPLGTIVLLCLLIPRVMAQSVVTWGGVTDAPPDIGAVKTIAAGTSHFLAIGPDGGLAAWGVNTCGQAAITPGLGVVVAVAAGEVHNLALRADGTVASWGCQDKWGLAEVPQTATPVAQVAAGTRHSLALCSDRSVIAWGGQQSRPVRCPGSPE
jgi:alpha-tubulin suppressor-like RCC1 family protein